MRLRRKEDIFGDADLVKDFFAHLVKHDFLFQVHFFDDILISLLISFITESAAFLEHFCPLFTEFVSDVESNQSHKVDKVLPGKIFTTISVLDISKELNIIDHIRYQRLTQSLASSTSLG